MLGSSSVAPGAAQRGLQARHELARAERLGDVVVGARLQRPDLLLLLADGGQHEDRHLAPLAQRARHLHAVAVRQHQVDDRRLRRAHRREVERLRGGFGGHRLEAGLAQHHLQRAHDLRLVVDHEHARRLGRGRRRLRAHAAAPPAGATGGGRRLARARRPSATPTGSAPSAALFAAAPRSGSSNTNVAPWPGSDSTCSDAAVRLGEAPRDRQAEPRAAVPAGGRAGAVERLEHALELRRRDARAAIDHAHDHAVARRPLLLGAARRRRPPPLATGRRAPRQAAHRARAHRHRMPAGVPARVLEHVHERPLHLHRVDAHQRQVAVDREAELLRARRQLAAAPRGSAPRPRSTPCAARPRPLPAARGRAGCRPAATAAAPPPG